MTQPLVSILIPCHDAAPWVGQAIESALSQDYPETEVIVVDDGSTDGSAEVIARFAGRVRAARTGNRGAGAARNLLLRMSRGDWLQYLDADDYLLPGKVSGQVAALAGLGEVPDVLYGPELLLRGEGTGEGPLERLEIPEPRDPWVLLANWRLPQTGAPLWRKAALDEVSGWKEGQRVCQEHELYLRLLKAGKSFAYAEASGAVYRRREAGTLSTRDQAETTRHRLAIVDEAEAFLAATGGLTPRRQDEINQARFECARVLWPRDRAWARRLMAQVRETGAPFTPRGQGVPPAYVALYRFIGFEGAERVAAARRAVRGRWEASP